MGLLTETFVDASGNPTSGQFRFWLTARMPAPDEDKVVAEVPVTARLDPNGVLAVELVAVDDPGLAEVEGDLVYVVEDQLANLGTTSYIIEPLGSGPWQLSSLANFALPPPVLVRPLPGPTGPMGPPGPPSTEGGGAVRYVHTQSVLAQVWTVDHNLTAHPTVFVEDSGGSLMYGTVHYTDDTRLTITFARPVSGRANVL